MNFQIRNVAAVLALSLVFGTIATGQVSYRAHGQSWAGYPNASGGQIQYHSNNGNQFRGRYYNHGQNQMGASGHYRNGSGTVAGGAFARQNGVQSGNAYYQSNDGTYYQGNYAWRDRNNFGAGGQYRNAQANGYGGTLQRSGNRTNIGGNYSRPGTIAGTQERYHGNAMLNGRNSNLKGGVDLYDASGNRKLGSANGYLDRHGYYGNRNSVHYGIGVNQNENVRFNGRRSSYQRKDTTRIGSVAIHGGYGIDRNGVRVNQGISVGGNKYSTGGLVDVAAAFCKIEAEKQQKLREFQNAQRRANEAKRRAEKVARNRAKEIQQAAQSARRYATQSQPAIRRGVDQVKRHVYSARKSAGDFTKRAKNEVEKTTNRAGNVLSQVTRGRF